MLKNYKPLLLIIVAIATILPYIAKTDSTTLTPYQIWQDKEQRLGNAVSHLIRLESKRDDAHNVWTDNREDIRDAKIGAVSSIQRDPFSALASAISTAGILWCDINDDITTTQALSNGISALKKQESITQYREYARDKAYQQYVYVV